MMTVALIKTNNVLEKHNFKDIKEYQDFVARNHVTEMWENENPDRQIREG
jgi:hypothetical protein